MNAEVAAAWAPDQTVPLAQIMRDDHALFDAVEMFTLRAPGIFIQPTLTHSQLDSER